MAFKSGTWNFSFLIPQEKHIFIIQGMIWFLHWKLATCIYVSLLNLRYHLPQVFILLTQYTRARYTDDHFLKRGRLLTNTLIIQEVWCWIFLWGILKHNIKKNIRYVV
jgi:hypothetical protein